MGGQDRTVFGIPSGPHATSDTVAVTLLLAFVLASSAGTLLVADRAHESTSDRLQFERARTGLVAFATESSTAARGVASTRSVDLGLRDVGRGGTLRVQKRGRIVVRTGRKTILDRRLSAVEYESDAGVVAFQGGGVWRGRGRHSRMVSGPRLHYREGTVTLGLVSVEARPLGSTRLRIRDHSEGDRTASLSLDRNQVVTLTLHSEYYGGWEQYFRQRFPGAAVTVDHRRRAVTVRFARTGGGTTVEHVLTARAGDVAVTTGRSVVEGDVAAEGQVTVGPASTHDGNVTDTPNHRALDVLVDRIHSRARRGWQRLSVSSSPVTAGRYYLGRTLELDASERLLTDLSAGNVTLFVDGDVVLDGGLLRVVGSGGDRRVRIVSTGDLSMKNGRAVVGTRATVDARHLQVYGTSEMQVGMAGGRTYFEGVVYAPRTTPVSGPNDAMPTGTANCRLNGGEADVCIAAGNTAVEGSVHAGPTAVRQSTTVRYDPKLAGVRTGLGGTGTTGLEFLHVFVRSVTVDG